MLLLDQFRAQWAGGTLTASGSVPLGILPANLPLDFPQRPGPAEFTADLVNVDFSQIQALPDEIGGAVSAHAELRAPRLALDAITGRITFPELRIRTGAIELKPPETPSIEIAGGVARFDRFVLSGPESNLAITGTAALAEPARARPRARGKRERRPRHRLRQGGQRRGPCALPLRAERHHG